MEQLERLRLKRGLKQVSQPARWASSAILISIAAVLLLLVVRAKLQGADIPRFLVGVVAISFFAATFSGTYFLVRALREYRESEERFRQMASNIREIQTVSMPVTMLQLLVFFMVITVAAPTLGALLLLQSNHTLMHAGQFTVVRRKLGKPVLF